MFVDFSTIRKFKEGICFLCNKCRHQCSIYSDSIFYKKKIGPKTFKLILSLWCNSSLPKIVLGSCNKRQYHCIIPLFTNITRGLDFYFQFI